MSAFWRVLSAAYSLLYNALRYFFPNKSGASQMWLRFSEFSNSKDAKKLVTWFWRKLLRKLSAANFFLYIYIYIFFVRFSAESLHLAASRQLPPKMFCSWTVCRLQINCSTRPIAFKLKKKNKEFRTQEKKSFSKEEMCVGEKRESQQSFLVRPKVPVWTHKTLGISRRKVWCFSFGNS